MYYKKKLLEKIVKKNKLVNREKITLNSLKLISVKQKVEIKDLVVILGISKSGLYALKKKLRKTVFLNLDRELLDIKEIVNWIKLELKYSPEFGDGFYSEKRLKSICEKWNITVLQFLKYFHSNKKHYEFNILVLKNNKKGFWVGNISALSDKFIIENYDKLNQKCKKMAHRACDYYNCYEKLEDFISVALEKIIQTGGTVEKNFLFDKQLQLNILGAKAKYAITNFYYKYCKEMYYEQLLEANFNEDRLGFLADNKYNPEQILENKVKEKQPSFLSGIKGFKNRIIEEINNNLELFDIDRAKAIKVVALNLGITENKLEQNINQIQNIILKNKTE